MSFDNLLLERDGPGNRVGLITINRPKVLNAQNAQTIDELRRAMLDLQRDEDVRAVVVTGAGEKSFVAGADINELAVQTPTGGREHALAGQHVFDVTLRIAADSAKIGQPEINLGLIPGYAGTQRLARLVGRGRAMEMILTGAPIAADEAWRIGLVNRVVPAASLMTEARALAAQLASSAPIAMRYIINAVNKGIDMPFADACQYEATLFGLVASTDDMREGTTAFLD
ncbi:MAG: hypothetical protein DMF89_22565, partial [Acidobacteria bacterium]